MRSPHCEAKKTAPRAGDRMIPHCSRFEASYSLPVRVVKVPLDQRSYIIKIGTAVLAELGQECAALGLGKRCAIITDAKVGPRYDKKAKLTLQRAGFEPLLVTVPSGETSKSLKLVQKCYDQLAAHRLERKS